MHQSRGCKKKKKEKRRIRERNKDMEGVEQFELTGEEDTEVQKMGKNKKEGDRTERQMGNLRWRQDGRRTDGRGG